SEAGKGIVMRREDLREGTKRAAEQESHKLKSCLSPGEKRNRKRMATVYSIERQVRTPASVIGVKSEEDAPKPRARNKRVWASVERSPEQVTEEVFSGGAAARPPIGSAYG
ncbi:MAG: ISKra4 family transposase, partial [Beggiatoa sp.]|nr:ISKra4 family transposase [Beggiatoa sp.]